MTLWLSEAEDYMVEHLKSIMQEGSKNPIIEQVLAHRYLYYVLNQPAISDAEYDRLEHTLSKEEVMSIGIGSSLDSSYTPAIKIMAYKIAKAYGMDISMIPEKIDHSPDCSLIHNPGGAWCDCGLNAQREQEEHRAPMAKFEGSEHKLEFYAERTCAQCHAHLQKFAPAVTVVCPCGWIWRG